MLILIVALIIGFIPAIIAHQKGHNFFVFYVFGVLFWIVALIVSICIKKDQVELDRRSGKKNCPHCSALIPAEATACPICAHEITVHAPQKAFALPPAKAVTTMLLVCSIIGLASSAMAASADNLTRLAALNGTCTAATAMDVVTDPSLCLNKVINMELPNGRLGFMFTLERKGSKPLIIGFFGDGPKQLHIDADTVMQPIDRVDFTFQGSTDHLIGAGSCRFSNPYKGKASVVSCTADTNQGKFAGEFISDGIPPNTSQFR